MTHQDPAISTGDTDRFSVLALTAPVAMGYIPLGTVFGFLFVQAGAAWWLAVLSSLVVFAGAAQYTRVRQFAPNPPPFSTPRPQCLSGFQAGFSKILVMARF